MYGSFLNCHGEGVIVKISGHWANRVTALRILLALLLPLLTPFEAAFLMIYAICCITDMLDGTIARKTGMQSEQGAKLDSIADFILAVMLVIALYPVVHLPAGMVAWICGIAAVRISSALIARARFGTIAILHTYGNKFTGFLLFLLPFCLAVFPQMILAWVLCVVSTLSALEELVIQVTDKSLDLNRKSIFIRNKKRLAK